MPRHDPVSPGRTSFAGSATPGGQDQSGAYYLLQGAILLSMTLTYTACPVAVGWSKVVGYDEVGDAVKGRPFKEGSVLVVGWVMTYVGGLVVSAYISGKEGVLRCFNAKAMLDFAPAGIGWALADACEILSVSRIDPATYGVLSQARLLSAACAMRVFLGSEQSKLQWGILSALTLVCMCYCMVPEESVGSGKVASAADYTAGVILALAKVALSVLSGVYGEIRFKRKVAGAPAPELHTQMAQISVSAALGALGGYALVCTLHGENMADFFGGTDGNSWDYRALCVAALYAWREWISNITVKRFDSLVKNICNAVALLFTYVYTVYGSGEKPFSALKALLLIAVVTEVMNYVTSKRDAQDTHAAASAVKDIPVGEYRALQTAKGP